MRCKRLDSQLYVGTHGQYQYCCVSNESHDHGYNIKTHTPQEWLNSDIHRDARLTLASGEFPEGCRVCKEYEEAGLKSTRLRGDDDYGPGTTHLDIRFGNSCNLKCITCWDQASSSIAQEAVDMDRAGLIPLHEVLEVPHFNWASDEAIDQLLELPIKEMYITGGEPMMVKNFPKLLERLDPSITVRLNTNGTLWNPKIEKLLKRFDRVNMALSIDAIEERIEYIRYGTQWKELVENVKRYQDFIEEIYVTPTISILNAPYMQELVDWCEHNKLRRPSMTNKLLFPQHLHVKNAPESLKPLFQYTDGWEKPEADPRWIEVFKDKIQRLDHFRGNNIKDYLPEVALHYGLYK